MESNIFDSNLENHKMFKDLKDSMQENTSGSLKNLMELKDDVLYVWNASESCLFTLNLKHLEEHGENAKYQKLHLLTPPLFAVERLLGGACGTRLCLWGPRGAVVAELPARWGRTGLFDSGKETVLCKSYAVDEKFLYSQGDVRRVYWHPSSLSHVLVLVSDNTIRLYNIALKTGPKLVRVLTTGAKPTSVLAGAKMLDSLGGTAVDFAPIPDTDTLLILRGNGDVYMIHCDLTTHNSSPPALTGPLTMYPPADDNYGEDSCSIAVVDGGARPSVVVIATCSTVLYHCLLLPEAGVSLDETTTNRKEPISYALYVIEAVELNIVLNQDEVMPYSYPVHLYPCPGHNGTYTILHAAGVHSVTLPIIAKLKEFMNADEADIETILSTVTSKPSAARYLLCTHGGGPVFRPPCGLAAMAPPLPAALVLCGSTLVTRYLEPYDLEEQLYKELQLKNPALEQDDINKILKEKQRLSFTSIIQEILGRDVSQPLLKIDRKQEPSPKETLEFLSQATLKLRQEYMARQRRGLEAIGRKVPGLRALKRQQTEWHDDLKKEIAEAEGHSMVLREKCALAEKHQDDLKYRCSAVIRKLRASSSTTPAELELLRELERFREMRETFADQMQRLKDRAAAKSKEIKKWQEDYKKKDIALGKSHSDTISSILQQQTTQISTLIEETKLLKDQMSIV